MRELNLLTVPDLYTLRASAEMHAHVYPPEPVNRPEHNHHYIPTQLVHSHRTRHALHSTLHATRSMDQYTKTYTRIWNGLPSELRATPNLTMQVQEGFSDALTTPTAELCPLTLCALAEL